MADPTDLDYQQIVRTGLEATYEAIDDANGNQFQNDGRMFVHVVNATGDDGTVTIDTPNTVDGLPIGNRDVVVTDGEERMIGPFPPNLYNDANRRVQLTYTVAGAGMTIALLRL
jgi:hypothetical protein